jgi:uncharacterized membrane protein
MAGRTIVKLGQNLRGNAKTYCPNLLKVGLDGKWMAFEDVTTNIRCAESWWEHSVKTTFVKLKVENSIRSYERSRPC